MDKKQEKSNLSTIKKAYIDYLKHLKQEHPSVYEKYKEIILDNLWQLRGTRI